MTLLPPHIIRLHPNLFRTVCLALLAIAAAEVHPVAADLIPRNDSWSYFKGTAEPSPADIPAWRQIGFNDSQWSVGVQPLYYGEPLTGTELPDMRGSYTTVYFRKKFVFANPGDIESATIKAISDDGFVAWINGKEVARFNVSPTEPPYNATAVTTFNEPLPIEDYPVNNPGSVFVAGENVLAIQGFNASLNGSSDFVMDAWLEFTRDDSAPVVEQIIPTPGAVVRDLSTIEIQFSEEVTGVDAADLLVNGQPASSVEGFGPGQFVFAFPKQPTGPVTIAFRPNHGITDLAATPHPFAGGSWNFTVDPNAPAPGLQINEFMADNDHTLRDEDGDRSDWVELLNSGTSTVSLAGWSLSDDPAALMKWKFPPLTLAPNNFLLLYASGKNRTNNTARLHTNFKLTSNAGGFLALANPSGEIVSVFTNYPAQFDDVSYGRAAGAPNVVGYFVQATPGAPNNAQGEGFSPPVDFSDSSRTYQGSLPISLSTTNSNAIIHYTTDGSLPDETSLVYTSPLNLTAAVQIRARAFVPGLLPGPPRSETFIPLANQVAAFSSDLPVMIIHDFNRGRPPANSDTFAYVQLFEPDTNGVTSLTNRPTLTSRSIIAARGSSTEGYGKVSLKLELQDEFGFDRHMPVLGMPSESDWVLYAPNNFEPILIHNPFAHQLSRDIGRYSPRTRFVEVYLVQSGTGAVAQSSYNGIYVLEEKIKLTNDRVDAPTLSAGQDSPPAVTGGYLMKIDRADPGDSGFYTGHQGALYVDPKEEEIELPERAAQRNYITSYMSTFDTVLYGANYRNPTNGFRAYAHVDSWIDHHLMNVLTFNVDALRLSAFFYKQRDGKIHFGPLWDFDRALYSTDGRDSNPRVWRSQLGDRGTDFFNYPWWDRMFTDPDFFQTYIDRYQELRRDQFSTTNLWRLTDDLANQVRQAQPREQAKWGVNPRGGFQGEINSLKSWLSNRVDFMDSQFVKPPFFLVPGQVVSNGYQLVINVPAQTTVYYTLDGTDPRASGSTTGADIAPNARIYNGPITLTANARVFARARNPNHSALTGADNPPLKSIWSGPIVDTYVVKPFPLVITEIMYHPKGDGSTTSFDSEDFEFLELKNNGTESINLTGFDLDGSVEFDFTATNSIKTLAPGERLVLAGNAQAFKSRYPTITNLAGEYHGKLGNDGSQLNLHGPLQELVFDFRYEDHWQTNTDGGGYSLVLKDENIAPSELGVEANWKTSAAIGGSPGVADAAVIAPVRLETIVTANTLTIRFAGTPAASYTLQGRDQLGTGNWQTVQTKTASTSGLVEFSQPIAAGSRFYRVSSP